MHQLQTSGGERWRFGVFAFDARTLELRRSGRAVRIRPQSLKLLALLLARPGELITRAELQRGLWDAETFVDYDQGVNHCIKELRAALGDDAESPRYIETLARRGYRFIAPVEPSSATLVAEAAEVPARGGPGPVLPAPRRAEDGLPGSARRSRAMPDPPPPDQGPPTPPAHAAAGPASLRTSGRPAPAARRWFALTALSLAVAGLVATSYLTRWSADALPPLSAIAVAPFATQPEEAAIGVGLADAIARRLGGQQALAIRGTVGDVGGRHAPLAAGRGSALVLRGEIATSGAELSVLVRLEPMSGGPPVWSDRFRARADELFSVEDVIAERVVAALGLRLAAAEQDRLQRRYTANTSAYRDYLHGRAALVRYTPDTTRDAIAAFERALERDPDYALARAGLAMACADMCLRFASAADVDRWAERAEAEARAALTLDPDLAEAHLARAAVARKREFDWNATMTASRRALMLNPNLDQARFFMSAAYYHLGYMEEALIEMEKGRALRGGDLVEPARIEALVALFSGNFAPALAHLEEVSRLSSQAIGDTYLALAAFYSGGTARGRTMLESLATHRSATTAMRSTAALAGVLAAQGERAAARAALDRVLADPYRDHHVAYSLGAAHAQLGDADDAFRWLRTAADTGFPCLPWFERDPLLDPVRRHPRFTDLLAYIRVRRESTLSEPR